MQGNVDLWIFAFSSLLGIIPHIGVISVEQVKTLFDREGYLCFRQLDLAPFDLRFWPHPLVIHHSAPGRSEALRRP